MMNLTYVVLTIHIFFFSLGPLTANAKSAGKCKKEQQKVAHEERMAQMVPSSAAQDRVTAAKKRLRECEEKLQIANGNLGEAADTQQAAGEHLDQQVTDPATTAEGQAKEVLVDGHAEYQSGSRKFKAGFTTCQPPDCDNFTVVKGEGQWLPDKKQVTYDVGGVRATGDTARGARLTGVADYGTKETHGTFRYMDTAGRDVTGKYHVAMGADGRIGGDFSGATTTGASGNLTVVVDPQHLKFNQLPGTATQLGADGMASIETAVKDQLGFFDKLDVGLFGGTTNNAVTASTGALSAPGISTHGTVHFQEGITLDGMQGLEKQALGKHKKQKPGKSAATPDTANREVASNPAQAGHESEQEAAISAEEMKRRLQGMGLGTMLTKGAPSKFKDNYIERADHVATPTSSLRTIAFNGKHLPALCPDFRKSRSAVLLHNSGKQMLLNHRYFTGARFRLKGQDAFLNYTNAGMNYFNQESLARVMFVADDDNYNKLDVKKDDHSFQYDSIVKNIKDMTENEILVQRQINLLKQIRVGYDAAAIAAQLEREELNQVIADYQATRKRSQAIINLPSGTSMVGIILNNTKYLGGISMLNQAMDRLTREKDRYYLSCDRNTRFMSTPSSRQTVALGASDRIGLYLVQLEQRLRGIQARKEEVIKIAKGWNGKLPSNFSGNCFKGSGKMLKLDKECSCKKSRGCAKPLFQPIFDYQIADFTPNQQIFQPTIYGSLADINIHFKHLERELYRGNLSPSTGKRYQAAVSAIARAKKRMISFYDSKLQNRRREKIGQLDWVTDGFPYKFNRKGGIDRAFSQMQSLLSKGEEEASVAIPYRKEKTVSNTPIEKKEKKAIKRVKQRRKIASSGKGIQDDIAKAKDEYAQNYDVEWFMQEVERTQEISKNPHIGIFKMISRRYRTKMLGP
jgi:hypothetical protein